MLDGASLELGSSSGHILSLILRVREVGVWIDV